MQQPGVGKCNKKSKKVGENMDLIRTFQDFEQAGNKENFIMDTINNFKNSSDYKTALDARNYYTGQNTTILQREPVFLSKNKGFQKDITKANNQIPNEFFPKIIKQANSYLLTNGANITANIKKKLGRKFDVKLQRAGIKSWVDGVAWAYCFIGSKGFNIDIWSGTEFIPLFDEKTSILRAGIRFWQIDITKPTYVELYEETGKTEYKIGKNNVITKTKEKTAYKVLRSKDALEDTIIGEENWSVLPIVPLYSNDNHTSALTVALKNKLDLYDIIESDFGNNLEDSQDVYWVLKNYHGQDLDTFLEDYKYYKSIKVSGDGDATPNTIEVPYEARSKALEILKKDIYDGAMAADVSSIRKGGVTATEIDATFYDLDRKTDEFENNVIDFVEGIITLYQEYSNTNTNYEISFTRQKLYNRTEIIENVYMAREDLSRRKTLELIADAINLDVNEIDKVLEEIDEESLSKVSMNKEEEIEEENVGNVGNVDSEEEKK